MGFTFIVYRLPEELRHEDGPIVRAAVTDWEPPDGAKVAQWDSYGIHEPHPGDSPGRLFVKSNTGYPDREIVKGGALRDRCPDLDADEWAVLDAWDMS